MQAGRPFNKVSNFYYTYVLKSLKNGDFYIGWTDDLISRVKTHNKGEVISTKNKIPFKLIYYEACLSRKATIEREKALKTGFGRSYLKKRTN